MKRILTILTFVLATFAMAAAQRLPQVAAPENYKIVFTPNLEMAKFEGNETISVRILKPTAEITLNAADLDFHDVSITSGGSTQKAAVTLEKEKEMVVLAVQKPLPAGAAIIRISYAGILNDEMRGLYLGKDDHGRKYAASQFEATDARRAFPSPSWPIKARLRFRTRKSSPIPPDRAANTLYVSPLRSRCPLTWWRSW
jgi:aminopeptidase N